MLRLIFVGILLAAAIWVLIAGLKRRQVSFLALAVLVGGAGVIGWFEWRWVEAHDKISSIVAEVSANPAGSFTCQRAEESWFDGEVATPSNQSSPTTVNLKYGPCSQVINFMNSENKSNPSPEQVDAIHLLTVEIARVSGEMDPRQRECMGLEYDAVVSAHLGASAEQARFVQSYYAHELAGKRSGLTNKPRLTC